MRVLIAVHGYPPTQSGGAERRAERTARGLTDLGHDVRVLAVDGFTETGPAVTWEDHAEDGVTVRRLMLGPPHATGNRFQNTYANKAIGSVVAEMIDGWKPDVLHVFSGYLISASAIRAAAERRVATVVSLTDYWWLCHRIILLRTDGSRCDGPSEAGCARCHAETFRRYRLPTRAWPAGAQALWSIAARSQILRNQFGFPSQRARAETLLSTLQQVDALIAPSQYLANQYIGWGVEPTRVRVWRQGVALDRCLLRTPSAALRVGYIGQMKVHKGVDVLLEAWSRLVSEHRRRLTLYGSAAGEDEYAERVRSTIQQLKDAIWAGEFRGSEVWQLLANLDVLVVPSRWVENSPNSILEAQAVGVPVVGTNLGGIAEMVRHEENGLLFEVDDAAGLAKQLQRLLDEPELLERLRRASVPFQTVEEEIRRIEGLYHSLASRSDVPGANMATIGKTKTPSVRA